MGRSPTSRNEMRPVCMITGADSHLGTALCQALGFEYRLVATYENNHPPISSQLRKMVDLQSGEGADHSQMPVTYCIRADLTRREDVTRMVELTLARFDQIDVLVNAVSDLSFRSKVLEIWQIADVAASEIVRNSLVPIQVASLIHDLCWKEQPIDNARWNRNVVNISSTLAVGIPGGNGHGLFAASKGALNTLTRYLALELSKYRVRANAICAPPLLDENVTHQLIKAVGELIRGDNTGSIVSEL
jgi:NAD(P)-dependent dehydrogenase (short-subunit alcohol dehydrogenase family)